MKVSRNTLDKRIAALEAVWACTQVKPPPPEAPNIEHVAYQIFESHQTWKTPVTYTEAQSLANYIEACVEAIDKLNNTFGLGGGYDPEKRAALMRQG